MYSSARDFTMRIMIADDERTARARLRRELDAVPNTEIAGEAADGLSAVEQIRKLRPDLAILDVQMPELDGFGVLRALAPDERQAVERARAQIDARTDEVRLRALLDEALASRGGLAARPDPAADRLLINTD